MWMGIEVQLLYLISVSLIHTSILSLLLVPHMVLHTDVSTCLLSSLLSHIPTCLPTCFLTNRPYSMVRMLACDMLCMLCRCKWELVCSCDWRQEEHPTCTALARIIYEQRPACGTFSKLFAGAKYHMGWYVFLHLYYDAYILQFHTNAFWCSFPEKVLSLFTTSSGF